MKRRALLAIVAQLTCIISFAQEAVYTRENNFGFGKGYFEEDALAFVIPAIRIPPSEPTQQDSLFYLEGLRIRQEDSLRFARAAQDAVWSIEVLSSFSEAVGIPLTAEYTPELWTLVSMAAQDTDHLIGAIKSRHFRQRPYIRWKEKDDGVADRERLAVTSSTPSGHSGLAATIVCLLLELYPVRAAEIIQRGDEFIDSRWILGFHYKSDCDLGRQIGCYMVNLLHSNPDFTHQLYRARKEAFMLGQLRQVKYSITANELDID